MKLPGEQLILDTNILVHWMRGKAAGAWLRAEYDLGNRRPRPILPVVVVAEIRAFSRTRNWGQAKLDGLEQLLNTLPRADISSEPVIAAYVELDVQSHAQGRKMGKNDLWIAAVARVLDGIVLTTDGDFAHLHPALARVEHVDVSAPKAAT